jgi:transposase
VVIKMARPSKLTPEVTKRLTEAIRAGNYYEAACGYAGIGYSTFRAWMVRGEKAKSGKYREFMRGYKKGRTRSRGPDGCHVAKAHARETGRQ